jgi:hypothetical protein
MVTSKRIGLTAATLMVAGLGTFVATGIGDGGSRPAAASVEAPYADAGAGVHRVDAPSSGASAAAIAQASAKTTIKYFETDLFPIDADEAMGDKLPCPRRHTVLGGYFGALENKVALTFSAPFSTRKWFVGVTNFDAMNGTDVFLGVVCAKGVES